MQKRPTFALGLGGALGGLLGAFAGHLAVVGLHQLDPTAGLWLKGPHGPPFFSLAVNGAVAYGGVAAGVFRGRRRLSGFGLAAAAAFGLMIVPMALATRVFTWGSAPGQQQTLAWFYLVLGTYTLACAAAVWLTGWLARAGDAERDLKAAGGALGGAAVGYAVGVLLNHLVPGLAPNYPPGPLPPLAALVDGMISGGAIGAGAALFATLNSRKKGKTEAPKAPAAAPRAA